TYSDTWDVNVGSPYISKSRKSHANRTSTQTATELHPSHTRDKRIRRAARAIWPRRRGRHPPGGPIAGQHGYVPGDRPAAAIRASRTAGSAKPGTARRHGYHLPQITKIFTVVRR